MKKHEAEKLIETIRGFIDGQPAPHSLGAALAGKESLPPGKALTLDRATVEGTDNVGGHLKPFAEKDVEAQYQAFKARLLEECAVDPVLLHLLTARPEIVVTVERQVVELDGGAELKGRIARLIASGFLNGATRRNSDISKELSRTGSEPAGNRLSEALDWLKKAGFLIREGDGWIKAAGVKVTERTIETK